MYDSSKEAEMVKNLKSMEVTPPKGLWDDIEATLDTKRKSKVFIITSWASAATIAVLISIGGLYYLSGDKGSVKISEIEKISEEIEKNLRVEHPENLDKASDESKYKEQIVKPNKLAQNKVVSEEQLPPNYDRPNEIVTQIKPIHSAARGRLVLEDKVVFSGRKHTGFQNTIAQNEAPKKKGEWFIATSGFPVYSFHTSGATNKSSELHESGMVSWGGSVNVRYSISNKFSLEMGLIYSTVGQRENNIFVVSSKNDNPELDAASVAANSYGILEVPHTNLKVMNEDNIYSLSTLAINESSLSRVNASQKFKYIEMPVLIGRKFNYKRTSFILKSGLSLAYLVNNNLEITGLDLKLNGKTKGVDPFAASAIASVAFSIPASNRINLVVEPTFRIGLKPLYSASHKSYPFSTFVKFGVEIPF